MRLNIVPLEVAEILRETSYYEDMINITPLQLNDVVYVIYDDTNEYEIAKIIDNNCVVLDTGDVFRKDELFAVYDNFPKCNNMYALSGVGSENWVLNNINYLASLGAMIFASDYYGYVFGVDYEHESEFVEKIIKKIK